MPAIPKVRLNKKVLDAFAIQQAMNVTCLSFVVEDDLRREKVEEYDKVLEIVSGLKFIDVKIGIPYFKLK